MQHRILLLKEEVFAKVVYVTREESESTYLGKGWIVVLEPNHSFDVFHYKSILKILAKFAGKHLYQDIFLRTLQGSSMQIYYNKDSIRDVFLRKQNLECLWVTASVKHIIRNFRKCFSIQIYLSKQ